jgi:hypothetical protein
MPLTICQTVTKGDETRVSSQVPVILQWRSSASATSCRSITRLGVLPALLPTRWTQWRLACRVLIKIVCLLTLLLPKTSSILVGAVVRMEPVLYAIAVGRTLV